MKYSTDWREDVAPDEESRFNVLSETLASLQVKLNEKHGPGRALHRKSVGGIEATVTVPADLALPKDLQVGPFVPGASYRAYLRFSHGTWERRHDEAPDIRGVAIKLLGVGGKKILTGEENPKTQDFLLIHTSSVATRTPDEFVGLIAAASSGGDAGLPFRLLGRLGIGPGFRVLRRMLGTLRLPFRHYPGGQFYSGVPYRFGPTAARFRMVPHRSEGEPAKGRDGHSEAVRSQLPQGFGWDFQVQLYQDPQATPIEDPSVDWAETAAPYTTIARIVVGPTEPDSEKAKKVATFIETLGFDPWHAVEELRPLGAMNRARKATYFMSTKQRGGTSEPDGTETF